MEQRDQQQTPKMTTAERIAAMAAQARLQKKLLSVSDVRYMTAGLPDEVTADYIYFANPIEVIETGDLTGPPAKWQKGVPKLIMMAAVMTVEITTPPK